MPAERDAVISIAARFRHSPLSLTLAASRASILGVLGVHSRLGAPLQVLGTAKAEGYPQSLTEAIEIVWEGLDELARTILACASLFPREVRPAIVEAVVHALLGDDSRVLDGLEQLRDASLLATGPYGTFVLDPAVREFAAEKLAAHAKAQIAREVFARCVVAEATSASDRFRTRGDVDGLSILIAQTDDVLVAFDDACRRRDAPLALDAALALDPPLSARGPLDLLYEVLTRARALASIDLRRLARVSAAHGRVSSLRGNWESAEQDFAAALEAAQASDPDLVAEVWLDIGVMRHMKRDFAKAKDAYRAVLEVRSADHQRVAARARGNLGALAHDVGEEEEAYGHYVRAVALAEAVGDRRLLGVFLGNLAVLDRERGHTTAARHRFVRALNCLESVHDHRLFGITLGNLGMLDLERSEHAAALASFEQSLQRLASLGDARSEAWARARLSAALAMLGSIGRAEVELATAERLVAKDPDALDVVQFFRVFPETARALGNEDADVWRSQATTTRARGDELARRSDDVRAALRALHAWKSRHVP
jgi:tetratricopeptide (TPR) repeat protein